MTFKSKTAMKNKLFALIIPFGFASLAAFAQNTGGGKENSGLTGEIVEYNAIKPKLADAVKIDVEPVQENISVQKPEMTYTAQPSLLADKPYKGKLQNKSIGKTAQEELNHGYFIGGVGNYANLYGELFYNTLRNRNNLMTVDLKHHSGNGPEKNSGFSENSLDLYGKHIFAKKYTLDGNLGYSRNVYHYYGVSPDSLAAIKQGTQQTFNDFNIGTKFGSAGADTGKLKYDLGVKYYNFTDAFKSGENDVTLFADAVEPFDKNFIVGNASFDYLNYKNSLRSYNRTILKVDLAYRFMTNGFRITAGFKTANETDTPKNNFHFYPDVRAEVDIVQKYLSAFGGITGNLEKNTFRSMSYENPFIYTAIPPHNTNEKFDIFGGLKGSFSNNSVFLASVAYKTYNNMYFYMNSPLDARQFLPVYDTGTTTVLNLHGELGFTVTEDFSLGTKLDYNNYSPSNLKKAFEKPSFVWTVTGKYSMENKLSIGGDIFFVGSRYAAVLGSDHIYTLKPFLDANVNITYSLTNLKGVRLFLRGNNLFNNKYQVWNFYPYRGFQIVGGVMISFL
jgi:hypothetical protein